MLHLTETLTLKYIFGILILVIKTKNIGRIVENFPTLNEVKNA